MPFDFNTLNEVSLDNQETIATITKELKPDAQQAVEAIAKIAKTYSDQITPDMLTQALGIPMIKVEAKPIAKEKDPEIARIEKEWADKNAKLEKELAVEKDARLAKEYVEKASDYFAGNASVPGFSPQTLGPVLRSIDEQLPAEQAKLVKEHFAACKGITSELKRTIGRTVVSKGGPAATATDEVERIAKEKVEKTKGMSLAAARVEVYAENPELAERVDAENRG